MYLLNIGHEDGERHNKEELNKEQCKEDVRYVKVPFVNKPGLGEGMVQQLGAMVLYHQAHWVDTFPLQAITDELLCVFHNCPTLLIIRALGCLACT